MARLRSPWLTSQHLRLCTRPMFLYWLFFPHYHQLSKEGRPVRLLHLFFPFGCFSASVPSVQGFSVRLRYAFFPTTCQQHPHFHIHTSAQTNINNRNTNTHARTQHSLSPTARRFSPRSSLCSCTRVGGVQGDSSLSRIGGRQRRRVWLEAHQCTPKILYISFPPFIITIIILTEVPCSTQFSAVSFFSLKG